MARRAGKWGLGAALRSFEKTLGGHKSVCVKLTGKRKGELARGDGRSFCADNGKPGGPIRKCKTYRERARIAGKRGCAQLLRN